MSVILWLGGSRLENLSFQGCSRDYAVCLGFKPLQLRLSCRALSDCMVGHQLLLTRLGDWGGAASTPESLILEFRSLLLMPTITCTDAGAPGY